MNTPAPHSLTDPGTVIVVSPLRVKASPPRLFNPSGKVMFDWFASHDFNSEIDRLSLPAWHDYHPQAMCRRMPT
jgi:hypothetical protein